MTSDAHFEQRGHHHMASDLPRHWIVLPQSVRRAALAQPLLRPLFPTHVGFFPRAVHHRIRRDEGLEQTIVKYCVRGKGWCELDGRRFEINPGDVMVVPRRQSHAYGSDVKRPWTVHWFHAGGENLDGLMRELGVDRTRPVVHLGSDAQLISLFEELRQVLEVDYSPPRLLYAAQLLAHLVGRMIWMSRHNEREIPEAEQRVLMSLDHIKAHLEKPPELTALASLAKLSPSHYSAVFRRLTGYAPKNYATRLRIHRAAQLLGTTNHSVKTVAGMLGYLDPLYFSRLFRLINGTSPTEYRQSRSRLRRN
jgi:AraC family transcriptional regulator of arabinose operon